MSKKVAYVTGGMGGIGTAICQRLHKDGFTVIAGCGPTRDYNKWLAEQKALGYTFHASVGNVADWDSTVQAFSKAKQEHGVIDVLVNNAGITRDMLAMRLKDEDFDAVIDTNLRAVFRLCRAVTRPMMKQRQGRIINITSVVGAMGNPGQANYAASKAGIVGFTKSCAKEVASRNITCNAIAPGFIESDMTQALNEAQKTGILASIPMGRMGNAVEIADLAAYLASRESAYVTGQVFSIDGGMGI